MNRGSGGYDGWSMSNRARRAYEDGEKPLSRWTKKELLDELEAQAKHDGVKFNRSELNKISAATLKDEFLTQSSWHHTSSHYNRTDFYSVDWNKLDDVADPKKMKSLRETDEWRKERKQRDRKEAEKEETWEVEYLEWSGTRKRPKATEVQATGVIKGNWFYLPDGKKKSVNARGFHKIRKVKPEKKKKAGGILGRKR